MHILSFYTFYCPHCKHKLAYRDSAFLKRHGRSLLQCTKCGKTSFDPFTTEPAIKPFRRNTTAQLAVLSFFLALPCAVIAVGILALALAPSVSFLIVLTSIFLVFWLSFFLYQKKNRNRIRLEKWNASDQRLRDPSYAMELANFGFKVPPQYLPADFKLRPSTVTHDVVLIQKPASLKKYPGPRADRIDTWHPERD